MTKEEAEKKIKALRSYLAALEHVDSDEAEYSAECVSREIKELSKYLVV